jgi:hypothetical protein
LNHEEVLAVLPDSSEEAVSIREIAQAMGLEITSYIDWVRAERRLVRALGALIKWGWVACDERQKEEGHKFLVQRLLEDGVGQGMMKAQLIERERAIHVRFLSVFSRIIALDISEVVSSSCFRSPEKLMSGI